MDTMKYPTFRYDTAEVENGLNGPSLKLHIVFYYSTILLLIVV